MTLAVPRTRDVRVDLPIASRVRVVSQNGVDLGGVDAEHRWPLVRANGRDVDLTHPGALPAEWAMALRLDLPVSRDGHARLALEQGTERIELMIDVRTTSQVMVTLTAEDVQLRVGTDSVPERRVRRRD